MNLPNTLTVARIFLTIPVFVFAALDQWRWALLVFLIGALTDYLDGFFARKLNQVTKSGKVLDQIADKVFVSSVMIALIPQIPAWLVALVVSRDGVVSAIRILAASGGIVIQANMWGKVKTVLQMSLITLLFFENAFAVRAQFIEALLVYLCAFFTFVSALIYVLQNRKVLGG
ncbi:MAG TPA: CDP-diacylglycerol--glycerol-3-phosphate 3-phosphatidyltransferase [Pseudothermotoga sp.]|nr:CDP-diacylglycerol--glycerol-3-phosphate 3-phosphatidyltransferase [Pseudothermotoga sp.]HOK84365.1 CDP-diacylglycerol--glycerol-3-phosphate 3-phosphatidyltransferase [Pseudothermotoga sp.]HPP70777.1 CDP-diacylglycerol--glycerol-3-phosphate 3-phosphatidyltransferase [Pseudothermotoga sp.]